MNCGTNLERNESRMYKPHLISEVLSKQSGEEIDPHIIVHTLNQLSLSNPKIPECKYCPDCGESIKPPGH